MHFHIITLFPEVAQAYLDTSIIARALTRKLIKASIYNPRDFTRDKHRRVDDRPYGGGPGMVLKAEPVIRAAAKAIGRKTRVKVIITSPRGRQFDAEFAQKTLKNYKDIVIICGHYEGVDARVGTVLKAEEVSVGPYILTGGELPALAMVDAMTRFVPHVLGKEESLEDTRAASIQVYTRPEELKWKGRKYKVPAILLSGDHKKIEEWRTDN